MPTYEMPFGDYGGGGGGGGGPESRYWIYLSFDSFHGIGTDFGKRVLESFSTLEKLNRKKLIVHYPMEGTEAEFRAQLVQKLQADEREWLLNSPAFAVLSEKFLAAFHSDIHRNVLIELEGFVSGDGILNSVTLNQHLSSLSGLLEREEDIFDSLKEEQKVGSPFLSAWELKPGLFGIRFDLKKFHSQWSDR